jgi:hypothetical protein
MTGVWNLVSGNLTYGLRHRNSPSNGMFGDLSTAAMDMGNWVV